jgi:hypothetical protein
LKRQVFAETFAEVSSVLAQAFSQLVIGNHSGRSVRARRGVARVEHASGQRR